MSGGDYESSGQDINSKVSHHSSGAVRLQRQSSDNSVVSLYPPIEVDYDEDPIMVWKFHLFIHPVVHIWSARALSTICHQGYHK